MANLWTQIPLSLWVKLTTRVFLPAASTVEWTTNDRTTQRNNQKIKRIRSRRNLWILMFQRGLRVTWTSRVWYRLLNLSCLMCTLTKPRWVLWGTKYSRVSSHQLQTRGQRCKKFQARSWRHLTCLLNKMVITLVTHEYCKLSAMTSSLTNTSTRPKSCLRWKPLSLMPRRVPQSKPINRLGPKAPRAS